MINKKNHGFTIVEILVAVSIGIILTGFLISIFNNNKKAYNNNNRMIELNSNIRFAMAIIRDDLVNAGYYGGLTSRDTISYRDAFNNTLCQDSGNNIQFSTSTNYPIWGNQASADPEVGCLAGITAGSDYISIRGVRGSVTDDGSLNSDSVYIRSGKTTGEFVADGMGSSISSATNMNWKYYSHIYYVCQNRLLRQALVWDAANNYSVWETHVLIGPELESDGSCSSHTEAGIENMQFSYGVDNDQDGVVDFFTDASAITTNAAWNDVVEVKIFILARSERDLAYTDSKTYTVGATAVSPTDVNYHRKVFSSTVFLRNNWYGILNDPGSI